MTSTTADAGQAPSSRAQAAAARRAAAQPDAEGGFTHRQILTILAGLMMGMFLAALDQTIVASAIRTIGDDLHGLSVQAWVTTAYLITSTISTPLYGKLSDIYGRRRFFLLAISVFVVGSALCSFATSMYVLAAFRAFQGLGAGGLFSLALAIIGDVVPPRERAKYQGYFLAVFGTSSVLGPVVGGFFAGTDTLLWISGWRWVFLVNVPIGILALIVVARTLHLPHRRLDHRVDYLGAVLLVVGLVPLLTVLEQGRTWGWDSGRSIACYVVAGVGLVAFVVAEVRMGEEALLPLRLFRNQMFSIVSAVGVVTGFAMFGGLSMLPLYLQIVRGATPTESGLLLVPLTAGIMSGSVISGQLISRTGRYKIFPVIGTLLMVIGMGLLATVGADTPFWRTEIYTVVFGLGLGNVMQPITLAVQNATDPRDIGVATSSVTFFRQMGATIGTAVFLSILFSTVGQNIGTALKDAAGTASFRQALADPAVASDPQNSTILRILRGGSGVGSGSLDDTSFLNHADKRLAHPFFVGFSDSMDRVFLIGAIVLVLAVVLLLFVREIPLRTRAEFTGAQEGAGSAQAENAPSTQAAVPAGEHSTPQHDPSGGQQDDEARELVGATATVAQPGGHTRNEEMAMSTNGGDWAAERRPEQENVPTAWDQDDGRPAVLGVVRAPDGTLLSGAVLTLTDLAGRQVDRGRSDAYGRFRLVPPNGGTFLLICAADAYQPAASMVTLAAAPVHRDVTLAGASRVGGLLVDGRTGQPLTGATLTLTDVRGQVVGSAVSASDGSYVFADLYAGDYTVTATASGFRPLARAVHVDEGASPRMDLALAPTGLLTGTVRAAASGLGVGEANVTLVDAQGSVVASRTTGADGAYRFADLMPGTYTLIASGYAPVAHRVDVTGGDDEHDVALGSARPADQNGQHGSQNGASLHGSNGASRTVTLPQDAGAGYGNQG